jgi:phospholipid/cholesterol/gamma-HCH transport system substrate-binding protein
MVDKQPKVDLSAERYVGIFTLVSILVLFLAYAWFKTVPLNGPQQHFIVSFNGVAGLRANSPINISGVRVGTVDQVKLEPDGRVLVFMRVDPSVVLVRQGAHFNIETFGLIGAKYVDITLPVIANGQPKPSVLDDRTVEIGDDPIELSKVADKFGRGLDSFDVQSASQTLQRSLNKLEVVESSVNKTSDRIGSVAQDLKGTSKKVNDAVSGVDLKQTMQNLQSASGKLDTVTEQAHQMLDKRHPLLHMTFGRPGHIKTKKTKVVTSGSNAQADTKGSTTTLGN